MILSNMIIYFLIDPVNTIFIFCKIFYYFCKWIFIERKSVYAAEIGHPTTP